MLPMLPPLQRPETEVGQSQKHGLGLLMLLSICLLCLPAQALTNDISVDQNPDASLELIDTEASDKGAAGEADSEGSEEGESEVQAAEASEAREPANVPAAGNLTDKDTVIATKPDQVNDQDIKQRISGIYSEIEGLKALNISVNQGVVSLSGEVPNEKKAQQAISLANRVSDVVAVEDRISRTLDVQDNVTPVISALNQQFRSFIHALPLLLVAIVVFSIVVWFGS